MTNVEILNLYGIDGNHVEVAAIKKLMDEARKDEAVEFGRWIVKNYSSIDTGKNGYKWWDKRIGGKNYTTEELYQLFKQPKQ